VGWVGGEEREGTDGGEFCMLGDWRKKNRASNIEREYRREPEEATGD
jgi:hypothetical protein